MIRKPSSKTADTPSDLELMLYADGELEDARRAMVEAYLARDTAASSKLAAQRLVSGIVRERALGAAGRADGIADAVMAEIESPAKGAAEAKIPKPAALAPAKGGLAPKMGRERPANDNARGIFALAAVALAAAAGLMLWSRMGAEPQAALHFPVATSATTQEQSPAPPPQVETAEPAPDGDDGPAVEVAAVDFGARVGTIFYVPTEAAASNATTTVVWLNDDSAGGE
jgi:anti-sigma factor RsiW